MGPVESLVASSTPVMVSPIPSQSTRVTLCHTPSRETTSPVEISPDISPSSSESADQPSLPLPNSKSSETSRRSSVTSPSTSKRRCKSMRTPPPRSNNTSSQMVTSSPLVTNSSDAQRLSLTHSAPLVVKSHQS